MQHGRLPFHLAAIKGHGHVIGALCLNGSPRDALADDGSAPLHKALEEGNVKTAELLIDYGANPQLPLQVWNSPYDHRKIDAHCGFFMHYKDVQHEAGRACLQGIGGTMPASQKQTRHYGMSYLLMCQRQAPGATIDPNYTVPPLPSWQSLLHCVRALCRTAPRLCTWQLIVASRRQCRCLYGRGPWWMRKSVTAVRPSSRLQQRVTTELQGSCCGMAQTEVTDQLLADSSRCLTPVSASLHAVHLDFMMWSIRDAILASQLDN